MNTLELLDITSLIVPDREAIVFGNERITYTQLQERVKKLANALLASGIGSGDRVASIQVNCNAQIEAYFATASVDAIYVPINFRSSFSLFILQITFSRRPEFANQPLQQLS